MIAWSWSKQCPDHVKASIRRLPIVRLLARRTVKVSSSNSNVRDGCTRADFSGRRTDIQMLGTYLLIGHRRLCINLLAQPLWLKCKYQIALDREEFKPCPAAVVHFQRIRLRRESRSAAKPESKVKKGSTGAATCRTSCQRSSWTQAPPRTRVIVEHETPHLPTILRGQICAMRQDHSH